mgnify:CR=1 FL=1
MTISTTKNTWESICDLFSSIEIKESSVEIKESATYVDDSFSIHLETVVCTSSGYPFSYMTYIYRFECIGFLRRLT